MDDFIKVYRDLAKDRSYFHGDPNSVPINDPELFKSIERYRALADIHPLEQVIIRHTSKRIKYSWAKQFIQQIKRIIR